MPMFRKKPVEIEAMQYPGHAPTGEAVDRLLDFEDWFKIAGGQGRYIGQQLHIKTLEGTIEASPGDWVIRGVKGEIYPCKPDIFGLTYEPILEVGDEKG